MILERLFTISKHNIAHQPTRVKTNMNIKNTTLSEQVQNPIEKS